jgi:hypothetical protein
VRAAHAFFAHRARQTLGDPKCSVSQRPDPLRLYRSILRPEWDIGSPYFVNEIFNLELFAHYLRVSFFNLTKSEFHQILCADSQGEFLTAISLKFLKFEITKSPTVSDLYIGIALVYKFDGDIAARPGLDKLSVRDLGEAV